MIAFFAEFDPVEYADFDDNELALDDSQPRLLLVVFPRVFIIIVPQDNDDDVHDDEERFLPNLELVNVFSRKRTPTSDDDDDDALVRVVQYKSIVVVTENAREVYLFVSFFSKKSCPFGGNVRSEKLHKTLCFSVLEREAFTKRHLCGQRRRRRQQRRRSVSA